ncbi:fibronectin type III domain-containing protein [Dactylosporangium siamense]|uniref:Fibronectin type-III domain-containing protein n=1 Tax=Dactylosporangium siamense TaxID=685454 RepID=A0A919PV67_9ACTN|nr:fibronectin type III domain-containing protein [Dactylosporangium siamense]GIG50312.1 hypothetical protein Dsi01nite_083530 [Dactylosporangium siamense]
MRKFVSGIVAVLATTLSTGVLITAAASPAAASGPTSFSYTGAPQTYTIPAGATKLQVVLKGAQGAGGNGGPGGVVSVVITTPPSLGGTIQVMVGGSGGWNGGGSATSGGGNGGGASDIRQGTCAATLSCAAGDRTVVAGGGGGGVNYDGGGGGKPAMPAYNTSGVGSNFGREGGPGTQVGGGAGGTAASGAGAGSAGAQGTGGAGGTGTVGGSGGGGGYYGGGGGGGTNSGGSVGGPGGGGSSYVDATRQDAAPTYTNADNYNTGSIEISTLGPPAPSGVSAQVTAGTGAIGLQWTAPGGGADSYVVYQATNSGGPFTAVASGTCAAPTGTSCTFTGTPGQAYYFTVAAVLSAAEGAASNPAVSATAIEPPAPPGTVSGAATGDGTMTVTWTDPSTAGAPASTYQVLVSAGAGSFAAAAAGTCFTGPVTSPCTVTGLTGGTSYRFQIVASNAAGTGSASNPSTGVVAVAAPGAPTPTSVTVTGSGTVTVAWSGPSEATTGFKVYSSTGGPYTAVAAGTCAAAPTSSPCTVTGLAPGQAYHFTISAVSGVLEGSQSVPSGEVTAITTPGPPGTPALTLAGARSLRVTWTYPSSSTAPATGFRVTLSKNGGPYTSVTTGPCAAPAASPCVLGGLEAGAAYRVRVTATNAAGTGSESTDATPVTAADAPAAPTIASVVPGDGQAVVTWTSAAQSVTFHAAAVPTTGSGPTLRCQAAAPALTCTIVGLANGTGYTITVLASGDLDSSPSSPATVTPSVAPAAPVVTVQGGTASITVSWTAAAAGSGIGGYLVTATPGPATCETGPTGTGCVLGAIAGTSYTVSVVAKGTFGRDSAAGVSAAVTPTTPPLPAAPPSSAAELTTDQGDISTAAPGQRIVVVGHGFAPHSTVTIAVYSTPKVLATAVADAAGDVEQPVTVPADLAAGAHNLIALGVDSNGLTHTLALAVTVPSAAASLPVTGIALSTMLTVALTSVAAGALLRSVGNGFRR